MLQHAIGELDEHFLSACLLARRCHLAFQSARRRFPRWSENGLTGAPATLRQTGREALRGQGEAESSEVVRAGEESRGSWPHREKLTQTGPAADPIWDVWAYGRSSHYIGVVRLSAKSGDVISSKKAGLPSL